MAKKLEPITPGEILLEEFMKPRILLRLNWPETLMYHLTESARLSMGSEKLRQTQRYVLANILV